MLVTFDLDSTLADTRHRHRMINDDGPTDWEAYAMACGSDGLIRAQASLWHALRPHHTLWVVSGRSAAAEALTARWLRYHNLVPDGVMLKPVSGGFPVEAHEDYKVDCIRRLEQATGQLHLFHIDDYPPVAEACNRAGYECIIVTSPQRMEAFQPGPSYV